MASSGASKIMPASRGEVVRLLEPRKYSRSARLYYRASIEQAPMRNQTRVDVEALKSACIAADEVVPAMALLKVNVVRCRDFARRANFASQLHLISPTRPCLNNGDVMPHNILAAHYRPILRLNIVVTVNDAMILAHEKIVLAIS